LPEANAAPAAVTTRRLVGEEGIWVLIFGDMILFSVFFITFFVYRNEEYAIFAAGHELLNVRLGVLNTLLMVTSSLFVALATRALRRGLPNAERWIAGAVACGVGFCIVKAFEYGAKIAHGITLNTTDFFTFYFMYTGIHLVHVLIGTGVLIYLFRRIRGAGERSGLITLVESGGSFWHLVDLLWIVIFPLFYLVR